MKSKDVFLSEGVCRIPLLPFSDIVDLDENNIFSFFENEIILSALFIASPDLFQALKKWKKNKLKNESETIHLKKSLYKYLSRMSSRCTPFGGFSSISYISTINNREFELSILPKNFNLISRLDTSTIQLIINHLNSLKPLKNDIKYFTNNSIYEIGSFWRYFEIKKDKSDFFQLSKVEKENNLNTILKFCIEPKNIIQIKQNCFKHEYSEEDILDFIDDLISEGILISELEMTSGTNSQLNRIIEILNGYLLSNSNLSRALIEFETLENILKILKNNNISSISKIELVSNELNIIGIEHSKKNLLHFDMYRAIESPVFLKNELLSELIEVKDLLLNMKRSEKDPFELFKKDYRRRYENRVMPLLMILDPETGIGYSQRGEDGTETELIKHLNFQNSSESNIELDKIDIILLQKVLDCEKSGAKSITINEKDFDSFQNKTDELETRSAFFSIVNKNSTIILDSFSGSSSINLMSRFSYLDNNLEKLCTHINEFEISQSDNKIIAEIAHIPETKSANLMISEVARPFEIPCITNSNKAQKKQIKLSDIFVVLTFDDRIKLFSKSLGKEIIPRLSKSINYNRNSINIFRFLCDYQFQNTYKSLEFNWGGLTKIFKYFPRVIYKNVILSPEYWVVNTDELSNENIDLFKKIEILQKYRNLPLSFFVSSNMG